MAGNSMQPGRSVASKVTAILLSVGDGDPHSLSEIRSLAGLSSSTAHRLVTELVDHGMLARTGDGKYEAGIGLRMLNVRRSAGIPRWATETATDLSRATGAEVRLAVLDALSVRYVWVSPTGSAALAADATVPLPLHATAAGKAMLAFFGAELVNRVVAEGLQRYTRYTLTSPARLRCSLAATRLTGIAVSRSEYRQDISAIAAPLIGTSGRVSGALEVGMVDLSTELARVQPALLVAARSLARDMMVLARESPPMLAANGPRTEASHRAV